jgi:type I restriction enzyme R subunit
LCYYQELFLNRNADEILQSFQPYYQKTFLEEGTDPNKLHDLETELQQFEVYTPIDVEEFAEIFFNPDEPLERLQPILDQVVSVWQLKEENDREDFRSILQSFIRIYGFISQIITFADIDLEKLYVFARNLNRKLPKRKGRLPVEVQDSVDLDSFKIQRTFKGTIKLDTENGIVQPIKTGTSQHADDEKDLLSNIINVLNETFGADLSEDDKVDLERVQEELHQHEGLRDVMISNNTLQNKKYKFNKVVDDILLEFVNSKLDLYKKLSDPKVNVMFKSRWFEGYRKQVDSTVSAGQV